MSKDRLQYMGIELSKYYEGLLIPKADTNYYVRAKDGQAKLIMTEIELMTMLETAKFVCKYFIVCGGAPGRHYAVLAKMYPNTTFILFDTRKFHSSLSTISNIQCIPEYVTANTFNKLGLDPSTSIFVSDMRSLEISDYKESKDAPIYNNIILRDMYEQLMLFTLSRYSWGMFKFKVPETLSMSYPNGRLLIQPFINSNELRLILKYETLSDMRTYDGKQLDNVCQIVNNYWKQSEDLILNSRIEKLINQWRLPMRWDYIAMVDIMDRANKLEFINEVRKLVTST